MALWPKGFWVLGPLGFEGCRAGLIGFLKGLRGDCRGLGSRKVVVSMVPRFFLPESVSV